ncbi:helix-turn-helix domain-containing protein [Streptomyces griseus]|uniref:helix-turn-helix domain-containing protein n=1 Tax=Streptomyces griseus TaxID=1911 RepID=UPI00380D7047
MTKQWPASAPRHSNPSGSGPCPTPRTSSEQRFHARIPLSTAQAARAALASRLDGIRRDAGLTGQDLATRCGWHKAKASRIAGARTAPSDSDTRAWCEACGAGDPATDQIGLR